MLGSREADPDEVVHNTVIDIVVLSGVPVAQRTIGTNSG